MPQLDASGDLSYDPMALSIPRDRVEVATVGVDLSISLLNPIVAPVFAYTTRPGGSSASFGSVTLGTSITQPDVAGTYVASCTVGGMVRKFSFVAVPAAIFTGWYPLAYSKFDLIADPRGAMTAVNTVSRTATEQTKILRNIVNHAKCDSTAITNLIATPTITPWPAFSLAEVGA